MDVVFSPGEKNGKRVSAFVEQRMEKVFCEQSIYIHKQRISGNSRTRDNQGTR